MNAVLPQMIAKAFEPILGRPAWQVKKGSGSFLTLEFGDPSLEIMERKEHQKVRKRLVAVQGDWHLWIFCCGWDILQNNERLAHNESSDEAIAKATARLDSQCLERLWIESGTVITHFEFDLGGELITHPADYGDDETYEQWYLYEPSGDVLSIRSDNKFCHEPGDTPANEELWLPLHS